MHNLFIVLYNVLYIIYKYNVLCLNVLYIFPYHQLFLIFELTKIC